MSKDIQVRCGSCAATQVNPLATVVSVAVVGEDGVAIRALTGRGVEWTGPIAEDLDSASALLQPETVIKDEHAAVFVDGWSDPDLVLRDLGEVWAAARESERIAAAAAYTAIRWAANQGTPEAQIARFLDVDRMTVRRALGKR